MATYRKYNWPKLFQSFEQSDLTQAAFCQQHDLNPKYFSRKRAVHVAAQPQRTSVMSASQSIHPWHIQRCLSLSLGPAKCIALHLC
ncbi:IS66 family insertion sequence element accessory protein TnpA [Gynuella sunshinyii]|uniref:IS66 family insertion sequence element accessory protein TnpA n=1 Tax=Gynuella sunshinyii TaxID=1445505 RepID=UPI0026D9D2C5